MPRLRRLRQPGRSSVRAAGGFTLLEVVVALAIAGIAFVGLFRAGSSGFFAVDTAGRIEEAVERAQSHLAAVGRDAALVQGDADGDDGGGYRWRLGVRPVATWQMPADSGDALSQVTLFDVEVALWWHASGRDRSVVLRSQRLGTTAGRG